MARVELSDEELGPLREQAGLQVGPERDVLRALDRRHDRLERREGVRAGLPDVQVEPFERKLGRDGVVRGRWRLQAGARDRSSWYRGRTTDVHDMAATKRALLSACTREKGTARKRDWSLATGRRRSACATSDSDMLRKRSMQLNVDSTEASLRG